mmetsp:Transcript_60951/g.196393  ORF Transcript_60951/g.196393 Transcript_60951/m.196393 type:complete len:269 (+) Transcript_60951:211-1017(+)
MSRTSLECFRRAMARPSARSGSTSAMRLRKRGHSLSSCGWSCVICANCWSLSSLAKAGSSVRMAKPCSGMACAGASCTRSFQEGRSTPSAATSARARGFFSKSSTAATSAARSAAAGIPTAQLCWKKVTHRERSCSDACCGSAPCSTARSSRRRSSSPARPWSPHCIAPFSSSGARPRKALRPRSSTTRRSSTSGWGESRTRVRIQPSRERHSDGWMYSMSSRKCSADSGVFCTSSPSCRSSSEDWKLSAARKVSSSACSCRASTSMR